MTLSAAQARTVFRACVVTAVREGETLMEKLVSFTIDELVEQESQTRVIAKRDLASEALSLLRKHQAALIKGYPMALLEVFADGPEARAAQAAKAPSSGIDFGELSLVDDEEVQAQVELSRAQQVALHNTEEVLSELNGLVSAAQGLPRIQPERNPLRPENYIRALQRVVTETQVVTPVREAWMAHMRSFLGKQLVGIYERASSGLKKHGVEQVGWRSQHGSQAGYAHSDFMVSVPGSLQGPAGHTGYGHGGGGSGSSGSSGHSGGGRSGYGGNNGNSRYGGPSGSSGYGPGGTDDVYSRTGGASPWQGGASAAPMNPQVEEALLTVNILRQMLAGGGDPYQQVLAPSSQMASARAALRSGDSAHSGLGAAAHSRVHEDIASAEVLEDMAQLERLVGRLAHSNHSGFQPSSQGGSRSGQASLYGQVEATPMGAEVVARMVENISRDGRLLPPIQKAVQDLEPAIRKLIRHDARFFSDAQHPARRLLDDVTQRSLAFTHVEAPGFGRFMRLIDQAVAHLAKTDITSAAPFETVRRALLAAWDVEQKKTDARQERKKQSLLLEEAREMRAERIADELSALDVMAGAPQDIADFVLGPWVDVIAAYAPMDDGELSPEAQDAQILASLLLWSVQPERACLDTDRLDEVAALLPIRLREELTRARQPEGAIDAFLHRIARLHREARQAAPPDILLPESVVGLLEDADAAPETYLDVALEVGSTQQVAAGEVESSELAGTVSTISETDLAELAGEAFLNSAAGEPGSADADFVSEPAPLPALVAEPEPSVDDLFKLGTWVELRSAGKWIRTQLTWSSPHNTLFLFSAPDGSTQSMTRRMRDKLLSQEALRFLDTGPVVARAIDSLAKTAGDRGRASP